MVKVQQISVTRAASVESFDSKNGFITPIIARKRALQETDFHNFATDINNRMNANGKKYEKKDVLHKKD